MESSRLATEHGEAPQSAGAGVGTIRPCSFVFPRGSAAISRREAWCVSSSGRQQLFEFLAGERTVLGRLFGLTFGWRRGGRPPSYRRKLVRA
jgi:hypothetical protein